MNINKIKASIKDLKGQRVSLIVNLGRNKEEFYEGILENIYPFLFTVKVKDQIKSFTYSDVLTKDVIIKKL